MATQDPALVEAPKAKRERRSWTSILTDEAGNRLEARLEKRRDGWRTRVTHIIGTGKKAKRERGITEDHATKLEAEAAQSKVVEAALKSGWKRRESKHSFAAKPDAFTFASLPKPAKAKK